MSEKPRLSDVEARAEAATEGPWVYVGKNRIDTPPIEVDEADWGPEGHEGLRVHTAQDSRAYRYADTAFIAASRTDVPALTAAIRAVLAHMDNVEAIGRQPILRYEAIREVLAQHIDLDES